MTAIPSIAQELAACDRETGLNGNLKAFVKLAWPQVFPSSPFTDNWHIGLICEHYEACFRGQIRRLVVNIPPGGSKSSVTAVMFPVWGWVKDPAKSWIFGAYGQKLIRRDAQASFSLMNSKWFRMRWGDRFGLPTVPVIDLIKNDKGGFRLGTTPGAEVTGFHANYQVIDDPNKPEDMTKVGLAGVRDWRARTMSTRWRRPPEINSEILIMQRLHCDDLAAQLLEEGAVHICLPAEYDPARKTVTAWGQDPRTEPGELLDPVRLPAQLIADMRPILGPINAAAQLDQNPVPEGGAVFKREHLRFWSTNPAAVEAGIDLGDGERRTCIDKPSQWDQLLASWDCAFKDETTSDYVCGQIWGRCGAWLYLLDQFHGHYDFPETMRRLVELALRWPHATTKLVEDKANGSGVIQMLEKTVPGIVAIDPMGGKFSRASACAGFFEAHNVYLPDPKLPGFEWVSKKYIPELLAFPRAKNDDQVDATTQALLYLQANTNYLRTAMAKVRRMLGYVDIDNG